MNLALYFSAFTLGLLGSFHCAGMCGPIALVLPVDSHSPRKVLLGRFIYNSGRVVTYVVLGLIFGLLGLAIAMKGFQRELSAFTGVIIIATTVLGIGGKRRLESVTSSAASSGPVRKALRRLFVRKSSFSLLLIGVLNGLLPCGFVYLAIAGALATGSATGGIIYMMLFGLGTFPIMMMISVFSNYMGIRFKRVFSRISPLIAILLALFLIYRGTDMKTENCHSMKPCPHHSSQAVVSIR